VNLLKIIRWTAPILFFFWLLGACTKIEQTTMGGDLIPAADNVSTFDSLLKVVSNNYIPTDSIFINAAADHLAGGISNDPNFGSSKAVMFFEMKPSTFPFKFTDSIKRFDSAVLVLKYRGYYGDSSYPVTFNLYQVDRKMQHDTSVNPIYPINVPALDVNRSMFWGQKIMAANRYKDSIKITIINDSIFRTVTNELRIPLNYNLAKALFEGDSAKVFGSDSIFKAFLPGFALEAHGIPQAIHYFGLGSGSEIQFFYRKLNNGKQDTTVTSFGVTSRSAHAIKVTHDRSGAEMNNFLTQNTTDGVSQLYVEATPGPVVNIEIPHLKALTNRVLHRVELRVTELPGNGTSPYLSQLLPPRALFLDAGDDNQQGNYRGIPYDMNPFSKYYCFPINGPDFNYFGGIPKRQVIDGKICNEYIFNITRYVQGVITRKEPIFKLRLSAPYYMIYKECANSNPAFPANIFPFQANGTFINKIAESRIRLAGSSHPNLRLQMQVRIIYSKA
jgi:hypothetical protein